MMSKGFIKFYREGGLELVEEDPKAFLLLSQIALRARRSDAQYSKIPLKANQAFIGDPQKIGLSRQEYRGAQQRLTRYGLATFKPTSRGTIATLICTDVYDINADENSPPKEPTNLPMKNSKNEPPKNQLKTIPKPTLVQQAHSTEPLTRKEEMKECKKATTAQAAGELPLYECLQKQPLLSDEEKLGLMTYPEDRIFKAIQWASNAKIKTTLIQTLHWHCKETIPPLPLEKNLQSQTDQQREAWEYNQLLKDHGLEELFAKNQEAIPQFYAHIITNGRETTTSLKNPIKTVKEDFKVSMDEILQKTKKYPNNGVQHE